MNELLESFKNTIRQLSGGLMTEEEIDKRAREMIKPEISKETLNKSIYLHYYSSFIPPETIESFRQEIEKTGHHFIDNDKTGKAYASFGDVFNEIVLVIGIEATTVLLGALGSGVYDLTWRMIEVLYDKIQGKKITKISGGEVKEEVDLILNLSLKLNDIQNADFIFPNEISINQKQLKQIVEILKKEDEVQQIDLTKSKKRYRLNIETKEWEEVPIIRRRP